MVLVRAEAPFRETNSPLPRQRYEDHYSDQRHRLGDPMVLIPGCASFSCV